MASEAAGGTWGLKPGAPQPLLLSGFCGAAFTYCSGWCMSSKRRTRSGARLSPYLLQSAHPLWRYLAPTSPRHGPRRLTVRGADHGDLFLFQPPPFWSAQPGRASCLAVVAIHPGFLLRFLFPDRDHHASASGPESRRCTGGGLFADFRTVSPLCLVAPSETRLSRRGWLPSAFAHPLFPAMALSFSGPVARR